ncbi:Glycosyltransferase involved in cell wall bisynthesis [Flavobacterium aquidurense]|uniref:Glycosyl transferase family 1 domain-containing protein n=1 Tax=Flavobacterium frigidimaris TaxID=262320 RepID=A0ABX4BVD1_FLAFR|nr:glycosyltransferase [Flavobacterium frigidimaris]OXA81439.1 hypothetical protein B0A65_04055 [Flavobacterium frigidimaris]SDZ04492.1 Glycosyltransferase involved in cell wall bisynthesis [Flavobacterium aquidurense]
MENRILFIANDAGLYGANQSLINIISSLKEKNVFVTVVFPIKGAICDVFDEKGWDYHIVYFRTELCARPSGVIELSINILRNYKKKYINANALNALFDIVEVNKINIIHSNSSVVSIGVDLAKKMVIQHVWHLREHIHPNFDMYVYGGLEKYKRKIQKNKNIICITKSVAHGFGVDKTAFVLLDAVRKMPKFKEPVQKDKYFLFCGSIVKNKGIEEAIEAFYEISINYPNYKFLVVGEGAPDYETYLKERVKGLGMEKKIEFLGFRKDVDNLMANATAFLMCSRNEALGRVTVEAMINFCLVIGYNDSGTAEIVEDGKTGLLYKSKEELVKHMGYSIANYPALEIILNNAYKFALNNFLEEKFSTDLNNYYNNLD